MDYLKEIWLILSISIGSGVLLIIFGLVVVKFIAYLMEKMEKL